MASQRRMAVLPKWAGMFFMSVIMGGSDREKRGRIEWTKRKGKFSN